MKTITELVHNNSSVTLEGILSSEFDVAEEDINPLLIGIKPIGSWDFAKNQRSCDAEAYKIAWLAGLNKTKAKLYGYTPVTFKEAAYNRRQHSPIAAWDTNFNCISIFLSPKYNIPKYPHVKSITFRKSYMCLDYKSDCGRNGVRYYEISEELFFKILEKINLNVIKL